MKYSLFVFLSIITIYKTKCHVTNRTKITYITTELPTVNDMYGPNEKLEPTKSVKIEESHVYLEQVVYSLKQQNWTSEELPCLNETLRLLRSLQNFTLWAVWEWDSVSSQPQGLLFGNRYELGNFDECMTAPWTSSHPDLKTQYCLADIVLERTDNAVRRRVVPPVQPYQSALDYIEHRPKNERALNELTWGACVPAVCAPRSVERLMATMLARSHLAMAGMRPRISVTEPCLTPDKPMQFDGLFYSFIAVTSILVLAVLLCTYLNSKNINSGAAGFKDDFIKAFCIKENAKNLLSLKIEGIEVLYGIKFLTMCFIVMDHQAGILNSGPISDGLLVDQKTITPLAMFVLHDDLFVDTFFMLSGFLTANGLTKIKRRVNPMFFILKRYVRLMAGFAFVIFFLCTAFPYIGSGPLWNRAVVGETTPCRQNWWLSLLMLGNYINSEDICLVVSWYVPCDFQFFVATVFLYWLYNNNRSLGVMCAAAVAVASIIVPGIINYVNGLPAIQLFTYDFIKNPRANEQFHITYIKGHTRAAAYVVGFISGYMFSLYRDSKNINRLSKKWSVAGTIAALVVMVSVLISGATYLWRSYHPLEGALYAALNRPIWAFAVAMLVLCCSLGYVPLVKSFLSWYPWVPLSRLSYGLYLTHSIIIQRNVFVARNPQHNDNLQLITSALGVITLGTLAALVIRFLVEDPANNLMLLAVKRRVNMETSEKPVENNIEPSTSTETIKTEENGYTRNNLPATIEFSSKI